MKKQDFKQNFRPQEAAEYLGVGRSTLWRYIREGHIKTKKLSQRVTIISKAELERFANEGVKHDQANA